MDPLSLNCGQILYKRISFVVLRLRRCSCSIIIGRQLELKPGELLQSSFIICICNSLTATTIKYISITHAAACVAFKEQFVRISY